MDNFVPGVWEDYRLTARRARPARARQAPARGARRGRDRRARPARGATARSGRSRCPRTSWASGTTPSIAWPRRWPTSTSASSAGPATRTTPPWAGCATSRSIARPGARRHDGRPGGSGLRRPAGPRRALAIAAIPVRGRRTSRARRSAAATRSSRGSSTSCGAPAISVAAVEHGMMGGARGDGLVPAAARRRLRPEHPVEETLMPQIHLHAEPGDYAPVVILPGDPIRATKIAARFDGGLEATRQVNANRGLVGYTGTVDGVPVSVQVTMMGSPTTGDRRRGAADARRDDAHPRRHDRRRSGRPRSATSIVAMASAARPASRERPRRRRGRRRRRPTSTSCSPSATRRGRRA